ncbi:hypothetical protein JRQ81_010479 [Phrynocephalus forsythii]|uniref:NADH dehydrogenase [ubiquinone] 1 beta subcomplex subunit 10 n=1 Tax=Phrynocephalus forsythii TaxID=171643 RepID=A0A9Q0X976_9SAUR|nr:hypothetical protein JRQ81_010479 [Phrynocephalus forsythii]
MRALPLPRSGREGAAILSAGRASFAAAAAAAAAMPEDSIREVYPPKAERTPKQDESDFFAPLVAFYAQVVDRPVTRWKEWMDSVRAKNKLHYYHQRFRRVPDVTECLEDDFICLYEAEMQWRRDHVVDQHIVKIMQERVSYCRTLEGENYAEKCAIPVQQYKDVSKIYWNKYGDLGAHGTARKCLMKQKHQMIAERKAKREAKAAEE